jgi:hypothetical protein
LSIGLKGNCGAQQVLGSNLSGFQQGFLCFFLGIDPGKINQPTHPPVTALFNHGPEFHFFTHGISRSLQIFLANQWQFWILIFQEFQNLFDYLGMKVSSGMERNDNSSALLKINSVAA